MPICDFRGEPVGSPCGAGNAFMNICSPDKSAILECDAAKLTFVEELRCEKGTTCQFLDPSPNQVSGAVGCKP
jgi:hypothetical protein